MFRRFDELNAKQLEDLRKQAHEKKFLVIVHPNFLEKIKNLMNSLEANAKTNSSQSLWTVNQI